jgi:hypothetical protein
VGRFFGELPSGQKAKASFVSTASSEPPTPMPREITFHEVARQDIRPGKSLQVATAIGREFTRKHIEFLKAVGKSGPDAPLFLNFWFDQQRRTASQYFFRKHLSRVSA